VCNMYPFISTACNSCLETDVEEFGLPYEGKQSCKPFCRATGLEVLKEDVAGLIEKMTPEVGKEALIKDTELGQHMVDTVTEGHKGSVDGWVDDDMSFIQPWSFELSEISSASVTLSRK
jgi:hypothetical protein